MTNDANKQDQDEVTQALQRIEHIATTMKEGEDARAASLQHLASTLTQQRNLVPELTQISPEGQTLTSSQLTPGQLILVDQHACLIRQLAGPVDRYERQPPDSRWTAPDLAFQPTTVRRGETVKLRPLRCVPLTSFTDLRCDLFEDISPGTNLGPTYTSPRGVRYEAAGPNGPPPPLKTVDKLPVSAPDGRSELSLPPILIIKLPQPTRQVTAVVASFRERQEGPGIITRIITLDALNAADNVVNQVKSPDTQKIEHSLQAEGEGIVRVQITGGTDPVLKQFCYLADQSGFVVQLESMKGVNIPLSRPEPGQACPDEFVFTVPNTPSPPPGPTLIRLRNARFPDPGDLNRPTRPGDTTTGDVISSGQLTVLERT